MSLPTSRATATGTTTTGADPSSSQSSPISHQRGDGVNLNAVTPNPAPKPAVTVAVTAVAAAAAAAIASVDGVSLEVNELGGADKDAASAAICGAVCAAADAAAAVVAKEGAAGDRDPVTAPGGGGLGALVTSVQASAAVRRFALATWRGAANRDGFVLDIDRLVWL